MILSPTGVDLSLLDIDAVRATQRLIGRGFEAYLVGGCVRDLLLGRTPKDYDIATEARPPQVKRVFPRNCRIIGRRFKLAHLHFHGNTKILECSTFRRSPPQVENGDDVLIVRDNEFGTAEEDALRRDFTVNALFLDPTRDTILDYTDGLQDVRDRVIRTIGDPVVRFREDPVRILRAAKFAGRLGFSVEPNTLAAMAETAGDLVRSAPPRVLEEILRLLRGGHSLDSFQLLRDIGAIRSLVPVLADFLAEASHDQRVDFWRLLEALDHRVLQGDAPNSGVLLGVLLVCPVLAKVERHPGRSASSIAEELLGPLGNSLRLPRRDAGCLKRICGVQHRFLQSDDQKRFRTEGFLHGPYFQEALELFELRMLAKGAGTASAEPWRELAGDLLHEHHRGRPQDDGDGDHDGAGGEPGDGEPADEAPPRRDHGGRARERAPIDRPALDPARFDDDDDGPTADHAAPDDHSGPADHGAAAGHGARRRPPADHHRDDNQGEDDDRRNPFVPRARPGDRDQREPSTAIAPADRGPADGGPADGDQANADAALAGGEPDADGRRRRRRRRRRRGRGQSTDTDPVSGAAADGDDRRSGADDSDFEAGDAPASVRARPMRGDLVPAAGLERDEAIVKDPDDEDIDVEAVVSGTVVSGTVVAGSGRGGDTDDDHQPPPVTAADWPAGDADGDGADRDGGQATTDPDAPAHEGEPGRRRRRRRRRRRGGRDHEAEPFPASQQPAPHGEAVDRAAAEHEPVPIEEIVLDPGAPPELDAPGGDDDLDAANAVAETIAQQAEPAPGTGRSGRRRRRRGRGRGRGGDGQPEANGGAPGGEAPARPHREQVPPPGQKPRHQQQGQAQPRQPQPGQPQQGRRQPGNQPSGQPPRGPSQGGDRQQRRRDRDRDRRPQGPRDVDVVPRHRDRRGKVEVIEPPALDLSAFDVELDPKRVPTFGSIVEGKGRPKRRSPRVPDDGVDDYRPPPPPGSDAPPPPPPAPSDTPDTFGDW